MPESVKPKPPSGYADWIECVFADTEMRSHWLFGDPEKGRFYQRQDAVKLARAELSDLRDRLATATELVKEAYPHIVALDDARNDGLSGRLAAFLEGSKR